MLYILLFSEISSITIDSLTFIDKEERNKQKRIYKDLLIKELLPHYIEYYKSNNVYYDSIKTRIINQMYI